MKKKGPSLRDAEVGRRVRSLRIQRGMSQTALGDSLDLTFQQIQKYENGTNRISAGRLQQVSEILKVPVSTFFDRPAPNGDSSKQPLLEFVDTAAALRLLQAYDRIESSAVRSALVKLAETFAAETRLPPVGRATGG